LSSPHRDIFNIYRQHLHHHQQVLGQVQVLTLRFYLHLLHGHFFLIIVAVVVIVVIVVIVIISSSALLSNLVLPTIIVISSSVYPCGCAVSGTTLVESWW
jgi:hypothetical protein